MACKAKMYSQLAIRQDLEAIYKKIKESCDQGHCEVDLEISKDDSLKRQNIVANLTSEGYRVGCKYVNDKYVSTNISWIGSSNSSSLIMFPK